MVQMLIFFPPTSGTNIVAKFMIREARTKSIKNNHNACKAHMKIFGPHPLLVDHTLDDCPLPRSEIYVLKFNSLCMLVPYPQLYSQKFRDTCTILCQLGNNWDQEPQFRPLRTTKSQTSLCLKRQPTKFNIRTGLKEILYIWSK